MMKVCILDRCESCDGEAYVFVCEEVDARGEPFDRYRPCKMRHGSGNRAKWVGLRELADLLDRKTSMMLEFQEPCQAKPTTYLQAHFSHNEKPSFSRKAVSIQWRGRDLNPRHKAYESSALPTELPRRYVKPQNGTMPNRFCQLFSSKLFSSKFVFLANHYQQILETSH